MYGVEDSYFVQRFENEIAAADNATCDKARVVHLELALRYAMLAKPARKQFASAAGELAAPQMVHLSARTV